jgi:hypothetical protein
VGLDVATLDLAGGAREVLPAALDHVRRVTAARTAGHQRELQRRCEVVRHALLVAFGGAAQQPHQQEEGHHGRHEVGIGDLPGATMDGMPALLDALDDDRLELLGVTRHGVGPPP